MLSPTLSFLLVGLVDLASLSATPSSGFLVEAASVSRHASAHSRHLLRAKQFYSRAHSLGDGYTFKESDGWQNFNTSTAHDGLEEKREPKSKTASKASSSKIGLGGTVAHVVDEVWNGLKGIGGHQDVKITWYTGHDLQNPSCWNDPKWAPTDESFACALTLRGWTTQPKCFGFLQLCNGPKKCVFVRVVDSCAGCAAGSKHVDLTKSAFSQLADPDEGVLNVQMRRATDPEEWFEELWGPKE